MNGDLLADCAIAQSQKRNTNRMNNNVELSRRATTSTPSDVACDQNVVVINSDLAPTAREFIPSNAHHLTAANGHVMKSKGAVRKQYFKQSPGYYENGSSYQVTHDRYSKKENRRRNNKYLDDKHRLEYSENDNGNSSRFSQNRYDRRGRSSASENYNANNRMYYGDGNNKYRENNKFSKENKWRKIEIKGNKQSANISENKVVSRRHNSFDLLKRKLDAGSQRERLEQMINRRMLECLVCCEKLRNTDKIWSCKQCYHILHLHCTIKWASSSKLENGWRCPACQNVCTDVPTEYRCYCGKVINPHSNPHITAHSCGETCERMGRYCKHRCTLLCHPGPCPDCNVMVNKHCGCGATLQMVRCSTDIPVVCHGTCGKMLECTIHFCDLKCHEGSCTKCSKILRQECFCGKVGRKVPCTSEYIGSSRYSCGELCGKILSCGNHKCPQICHNGDCESCTYAPEHIMFCPCGQTKLEKGSRNSCLDPVPCCDKICGKTLKCGQPSHPHLCKEKCHTGPCPLCPLTTSVRCRCGHMDKEIDCASLTSKADDARCGKKCTKKRTCGKHKCNQYCCIEVEHICPLPCTRQLWCGLHRCPLTCHSGRCPPCTETSFEELYCECGASVLYPPVACGTRPPPCNKPCSKPRPCGHDVNHTCHTGSCPPCTVLCKRWCHGRHELRSAVPCYQENFSCGLPCGRELICGRHNCIQPCHAGNCPNVCTQKCKVERSECVHLCNAPCHEPPCPETPCKQMVRVTCQCGLRSTTRPCVDLYGEYQNIAMTKLATKITDMQIGNSVDISDIISNEKKATSIKILDCNEECRMVERNRRLAIGLQIRNPDISAKLTPRYSDYMKSWAKKDPRFCQHVHDKLSELVQLAKQSKQKSRSYSFESMNRDKRHFVHEYCEHFGCESAAYDQEPNRNVVATALREKSWLPSMSLLELVQRENGQRKVPGPVIGNNCIAPGYSVPPLRLLGRLPRPTTPI